MNIELSRLAHSKLLCAVSGGADSMCLLHYLRANGIEVTAAHFEHGIRGEESLRDMEFVRSYCREKCIPFVCGNADVPAIAAEQGLSIEECARLLRYKFLEEKRSELCLDLIATAHNLEDNAETLIFNLARGSGTKGLRGISPETYPIVRPLLKVSRREILRYLEENHVPFVEDSTNYSDDYSRNFIRHNIMPLMLRLNPRFAQAAGRTAELLRQDEEALQQMARRFQQEKEGEDGSIDRRLFLNEPAAIRSRYLRLRLDGLSKEHVDSIIRFCSGEGFGELDLPGKRLYRDSDRLYFERPLSGELREQPLIPGKYLALPEAGLGIEAEIVEYNGEVNDLFKTSYLKYEIIGSDLLITSRKNGDRIRPVGRGCTKSLKSLFLEHNVPVLKRDSIPIVRDGQGRILMVYGIAVDEWAVPKPGDKALKISFSKI